MTFNKTTAAEEERSNNTSPSEASLPDYFLTFPDDYELGDRGEFDLDGIMSIVPGVPLFRPEDYLIYKATGTKDDSLKVEEEEEEDHPKKIVRAAAEEDGKQDLSDQVFSVSGLVKEQGSSSGSLGGEQGYSPFTSSSSSAANNNTNNSKADVKSDNKKKISLTEQRNQTETIEREKRRRVDGYNNGKSRLKINFLSLGKPGETKQVFGRKQGIIPDGLCGTNEAYKEQWRFEVIHHNEKDVIMIVWKITNRSSGTITSRTETSSEATARQTHGKTICNSVVRDALDKRALELENSVVSIEDNPLRVANLQNKAKLLRPKRCLIGLLFFGLLHETVQEHITSFVVSSKKN